MVRTMFFHNFFSLLDVYSFSVHRTILEDTSERFKLMYKDMVIENASTDTPLPI